MIFIVHHLLATHRTYSLHKGTSLAEVSAFLMNKTLADAALLKRSAAVGTEAVLVVLCEEFVLVDLSPPT